MKPPLALLNYVYCWNRFLNSGKPLKKSIVGVKHQPGLIKAYDKWHLEGTKSGVRISASVPTDFMINTGGEEIPDFILYKPKSG